MFCTFLSAPIIYLSARMALIHNVDENSYESIVSDTRTDSSIVSIACLVSGHAYDECFIEVFWYTVNPQNYMGVNFHKSSGSSSKVGNLVS